MEVECPPDVYSLRAMVHLMKPAPKRLHIVHRTVPAIDAELEDQETADYLRPNGQRIGCKDPMFSQPAVPQQRREGAHGKVEKGEGGALDAPGRNLRKH